MSVCQGRKKFQSTESVLNKRTDCSPPAIPNFLPRPHQSNTLVKPRLVSSASHPCSTLGFNWSEEEPRFIERFVAPSARFNPFYGRLMKSPSDMRHGWPTSSPAKSLNSLCPLLRSVSIASWRSLTFHQGIIRRCLLFFPSRYLNST